MKNKYKLLLRRRRKGVYDLQNNKNKYIGSLIMAMTFKQKIVTSLLAVGTLPALLLSGVGVWRQSVQLVHDEKVTLHDIAIEKALSTQDRMGFLIKEVGALSESPYIAQMYTAFSGAFNAFEVEKGIVDEGGLQERYKYQAENTPGATMADANRWSPDTETARALQSLYISKNKHEIGAKEKLDDAGDGSVYSLYHKKYHPYARKVLESFGYYDIFLVEPTEGRIIYSVFKEVDFAMPLFKGPYEQTNFARVVKRALSEGKLVIEDFEPYEPSYGANASFVAAPIMKNGKPMGVVVAQIPPPNDLFPEHKDGYPSTESFIVSGEGYMRTSSPKSKEETMGKKIEIAVLDIVDKKPDGKIEGLNYHGRPALIGYQKLEVPGLDWIAIAEIEKSDITDEIYKIVGTMLVLLAIALAAIVLVGLYLAKTLAKPVEKINESFTKSSAGLTDATGQISNAVQNMVGASQSAMSSGETVRESSGEAARNVATVAGAVEELNISINDISRSITESNMLIDQAVERAQQTDDVVRKLGEAGARISDVIKLINDLAEQTNLLALNAAIEAARAGDAGRGFAVVADEVKKLASHTSEATNDITDQVKSIQTVSDESVVALRSVMDSIHQIRDSSTTVSAAVEEQGSVTQEIAASVQEAANRVDLVDQNMGNVEGANQETSSAAGQVSSSLELVEGEFKRMQENLDDSLRKMGLKA